MEPGDFDEGAFFKAVERCGARALRDGRGGDWRPAAQCPARRGADAPGSHAAGRGVHRLLAIPLTDAERDDTRALVRWFTRRYPTPAERFAYIRRARARWLGSAPRQP
jgi:hypothetical protein